MHSGLRFGMGWLCQLLFLPPPLSRKQSNHRKTTAVIEMLCAETGSVLAETSIMSSRVKKPVTAQTKQQTVVTQNWSGPLPPPDALARFDQIIPHGAERILTMTEHEQQHRHATEKAVLDANIQLEKAAQSQAKSGQIAGAIVSILSILSAVTSAYFGAHPLVSIALVSVPILGMVKALIGNKQEK